MWAQPPRPDKRRCTARPAIYFFEVSAGSQPWGFVPNVYVDISSVVDVKKHALFAHRSQDGQAIWRKHDEAIAGFRGRELGVGAAEAFVRFAHDGATGGGPVVRIRSGTGSVRIHIDGESS